MLDRPPASDHTGSVPHRPIVTVPFHSVEDFLAAAHAMREGDKALLEAKYTPVMDALLNDPRTAAVPAFLAETIDSLVAEYGDHALKSISLYCLNLWIERHGEEVARLAQQSEPCLAAALGVATDHAHLSTAARIVGDVDAFGSSDDWQRMIRSQVSDALLLALEEDGIALSDIMQEDT